MLSATEWKRAPADSKSRLKVDKEAKGEVNVKSTLGRSSHRLLDCVFAALLLTPFSSVTYLAVEHRVFPESLARRSSFTGTVATLSVQLD